MINKTQILMLAILVALVVDQGKTLTAQEGDGGGISFKEENLIAAHGIADSVADLVSAIPLVGTKAQGLIKGAAGLALPDELNVMRREMKGNQKKILNGLTQLDSKISDMSQSLVDLEGKIDRQSEEAYLVDVRALHLEVLDAKTITSEKLVAWKKKITSLMYRAEALTEVRERHELFGAALVETALLLNHVYELDSSAKVAANAKYYQQKSTQLNSIVANSINQSSLTEENIQYLERRYDRLASATISKLNQLSIPIDADNETIAFVGDEPNGPPDVDISIIPPRRVVTQNYHERIASQRIVKVSEIKHRIRFFHTIPVAQLRQVDVRPNGATVVQLGKDDSTVKERASELVTDFNQAAIEANHAAAKLLTAKSYRRLFQCANELANCLPTAEPDQQDPKRPRGK